MLKKHMLLLPISSSWIACWHPRLLIKVDMLLVFQTICCDRWRTKPLRWITGKPKKLRTLPVFDQRPDMSIFIKRKMKKTKILFQILYFGVTYNFHFSISQFGSCYIQFEVNLVLIINLLIGNTYATNDMHC